MPLNAEQIGVINLIEGILFTKLLERRNELFARGKKLVHYTTAENALNIIKTHSFWMRETRCMNDFSEVTGGHDLLVKYMNTGNNRARFIAALDGCYPDCGRDVLKRFDEWWVHIQTSTFVSCFSDHDEPTQDQRGRLSMWRAFGQTSGVAMILKVPDPFSAIPLKVFLSPVSYPEESELFEQLDELVHRIESNASALKTIPRDGLVFAAYRAILMSAVCLKQPAFKEEREWRLVHLPFEEPSPYVSKETEVIAGIPQVIHKIKLENKPTEDIIGISLPDIVDHIIIGPTQFPGPIYAALVHELEKAGVPDARNKVGFSFIPLRV
ncbi:MAG: DUF2971 domain-containing protein [Alphaproteobacteria bacterium]|nr:DUF2971 domain-containing protein [Alphaproteobacteria bacterium]